MRLSLDSSYPSWGSLFMWALGTCQLPPTLSLPSARILPHRLSHALLSSRPGTTSLPATLPQQSMLEREEATEAAIELLGKALISPEQLRKQLMVSCSTGQGWPGLEQGSARPCRLTLVMGSARSSGSGMAPRR